jgi:ferric-dicitrate binding protein FerR (iron transport regulator)
MRIGGRFPVGETETMLAALETNFNLRATRLSHNRVVLSTADE